MKKRTDKWGIYAPKDGRVLTVYESRDYGLTIIIEYPDGYRSLQGHNSEVLVSRGQLVEKGEQVAIMGNTGRGLPKPNKHSHFGLIPPNRPLNNLRENCVNPVPWLVDGGAYPCNTLISGAYQQLYSNGLFHEGLDFSGLDFKLIDGWEYGIEAHGQRFYVL